MSREAEWVIGMAILVSCQALLLAGQSPGARPSAAQTILATAGQVAHREPAAGKVIREIDDPHTGDRWLLLREPSQPGGPGRLVLAATLDENRPQGAGTAIGQHEPMPVIHTGDRLIVEEKTAVAEARLQAMALGPALLGSPLKVRLFLGGAVVWVVALGPGRAVFARETGGQP